MNIFRRSGNSNPGIIIICFASLVSLLFQAGCTHKTEKAASEEYIVEGVISGAENKKIYLRDQAFYHDFHPRDSVVADEKGHFSFTGVLKEPTLYAIGVEGVNALTDFYLDNSKVTISGSTDSLWTAKIGGSHENDLRSEFVEAVSLRENELEYGRLEHAYDSAKILGDTTAGTKWNAGKKALEKKLHQSILGFVKQHQTSMVSVNSLYYFLENDLETADSLMQALKLTVVADHGQVVFLKDVIDKKKRLLPGQIAPPFSQTDIAGKEVSLNSFKDNYVLIDFWASWCGPCRQENPNLIKAFKKYNAKKFTILSVSLDDKRDNWLKAIEKDKISAWPQVSDLKGSKNRVAILYAVDAIPINYLVDPSGKIVAKNLRGEDLEKTLNHVLN